jgi:four helix bundle protein
MFYRTGEKFPKHELFGTASQIRRAPVSVEANIAEGYALKTAPNYLRHMNISVGSLAEVECHREVADDLGYVSGLDYLNLIEKAREAGCLLSRLKMSIERNTQPKL